jgi:putative transposase
MAEGDGTGLASVAQAALVDDPEFLRGLVERAVQAVLEAEMEAHLGAARYERSEHRAGYRNGSKSRQLRTRVGTLELRVPQDREGTFSTELFTRYQRSEQALVATLLEMYVQGVSTRKVAAITEQLCGTSFSKSQVSALAGRLDAELAAWRERPLTAARYPYLVVDARYEHVRIDGRVVSQGVLIVAGVRDDGRREILAVEVADTESEATYEALFRRLKARGVGDVELVTSDDHAGVRAAITRHFQGAAWQRCQVHFARNLLGRVGAKHRARLGADLRGIFAAGSAAAGRGPAPARAPGAGRGPRLRLRRRVAGQPPARGHGAGGGPGGLPRVLPRPGATPGPPAHDERGRAAQPGTEAPHAGGAHLPQPGGVAPLSHGVGHGAIRRMGQRAALPGHGTAPGGTGAGGDIRRPSRVTTSATSVEAFYRNSRT